MPGVPRTGYVQPKTPYLTPPKVGPVEAQALEALRVALRTQRAADYSLAQAKRGGAKRYIAEAEAKLADARTRVTEARCDLDTALED